METINYHIKSITNTFEELFKGNFLLFFIPGIVLTVVYYWFTLQASTIINPAELTTELFISWYTGVGETFSLFQLITEQLYIFMVLTVLSPFNTYLGEKLDEKYTGRKFEGGLLRFFNDFIRMIFIVILALFLELIFIGLYWIISWIIGLELLDTIVYFCITGFFFGFSFYDFSLERYETGVFSSLDFAFNQPLTMILTGAIFIGIYNIPIIGVPLAPVITIMVSTLVYLYLTKKI
jgi:CysZ protein